VGDIWRHGSIWIFPWLWILATWFTRFPMEAYGFVPNMVDAYDPMVEDGNIVPDSNCNFGDKG
jgi:hypothetical protein